MVFRSAPIDHSFTTVDEWFSEGLRVRYDPVGKRIQEDGEAASPQALSVFERVEGNPTSSGNARWLTLLPGFPDGSYGFAKVEKLLTDRGVTTPRLYVEYVGQGDSDKPKQYTYGTMERADLVQAQWRAHGIRRTVVVTFDYSSLVLMELLRRAQEGSLTDIKIEHVLIINGGLFPDGHTHPFWTTPILKTRVGGMTASLAQRSNLIMDRMMQPLYGKEYRRTNRTFKRELRETEKAIRLHHGMRFVSKAAGFVDEHKQKYGERWHLQSIYLDYCQSHGVTLQIVGSDLDPFEHKQLALAKQRLGGYYPQVSIDGIPGGHLSTAERAPDLADRIQALATRTSLSARAQPSWTSI